MENLDKLVLELCKRPYETAWVEFKENNCNPTMIGQDISALANSAAMEERSHAYMVWGVDDKTHNLIGTHIRLREQRKGNEELESWLRHQLSGNADFEMCSVDIDGKHVELLVISKALGIPVTFEKVDYIRVGSYTKKAVECPVLQAQLWDKLRQGRFEEEAAAVGLSLENVARLLRFDVYFEILGLPLPADLEGLAHYMLEEGVILRQDDGLYAITNLGAILFARNLQDFPRLARKAIRIVQYDGNNRMSIQKEEVAKEGYALSFEYASRLVNNLLPSKENVQSLRLETISKFPLPAIREAIANSLIHQDFTCTGVGPSVELFDNRVEVTNPGTPLVDIMRIIDNPPRSRNERIASLMRRLKMCEELGRGWDRMVISCEMQRLPAPQIQIYQESTRVTLFSHIDFTVIPNKDKLWAAYIHACIRYIQGEALTNSSLRERFEISSTSSASVSRLIREAVRNKLIKAADPNTAPRHMKYIPEWA